MWSRAPPAEQLPADVSRASRCRIIAARAACIGVGSVIAFIGHCWLAAASS